MELKKFTLLLTAGLIMAGTTAFSATDRYDRYRENDSAYAQMGNGEYVRRTAPQPVNPHYKNPADAYGQMGNGEYVRRTTPPWSVDPRHKNPADAYGQMGNGEYARHTVPPRLIDHPAKPHKPVSDFLEHRIDNVEIINSKGDGTVIYDNGKEEGDISIGSQKNVITIAAAAADTSTETEKEDNATGAATPAPVAAATKIVFTGCNDTLKTSSANSGILSDREWLKIPTDGGENKMIFGTIAVTFDPENKSVKFVGDDGDEHDKIDLIQDELTLMPRDFGIELRIPGYKRNTGTPAIKFDMKHKRITKIGNAYTYNKHYSRAYGAFEVDDKILCITVRGRATPEQQACFNYEFK